ncbi:MAG: hypothetical protein WBM13_12865 [Bacteroidia bacterium]
MDTNTKIATGNNRISYPAHKTITLIEEKAIEKKTESTSVTNLVKNVEKQPVNNPVSDNKTVVNAYPSHKTIMLIEDNAIEKKIESTPVTNLVKNVEKLPVNNPVSDNKTVVNAYPSHKTIVINTDSVKPFTDVVKEGVEVTKNISFVVDSKVDATVVKPQSNNSLANPIQSTAELQNQFKDSYRAHKTVMLEGEPIKTAASNVVNATVETDNIKLKTGELQPLVSTKTDLNIGKEIDNTLKYIYPAHKTFSFVESEVLVNKAIEENVVVASSKTINSTVENKVQGIQPVVGASAVDTKEKVLVAQTKKPILWIVASAAILLTSAATIWYTSSQKNKLEQEITALKQTNAELVENVQKLQKDLYLDDIIARAGVLDAKNNIVVQQEAIKSDVVRTCFSVMPNKKTNVGKKIVYIRLLDGNGNVLLNSASNSFEYKGSKIEYSIKKEVDFKGVELMLCVDYKLEKKLEKGTYKAELYNDGVLDGTSSFELK